MAFNLFPFTNLHNLNTDWILKTIKDLKTAAETAASQVQEALANAVLYTSQSKDTSSRRVACTNIHAVSYDSTPLQPAEAAQARTNIGAASFSDMPTGLVSYAEAQSLTPEQTAQARSNIEAASASALTSAENRISSLEGSRVSYAASQSLTDTQKARARSNIGAISAAEIPPAASSVLYTEQSLTSTQQAQARSNISAAAAGSYVRYDAQSLTAAQKQQARTNIGVTGTEDQPLIVTVLPNELGTGYECDTTVADIIEAAEYGRLIIILFTPISSYIEYQCVAYIDPISSPNTIVAYAYNPENPGSFTAFNWYRIYLASGSGSDTLVVSQQSGRLVPIPQESDTGKILKVAQNGLPGWAESPAVITDTSSTTPTIATAVNDTIYKFTQDLTSLSLTAGSGSYMICFHSGTTPTTTSFPVSILGLDDFVPEANTYYEINIMDGRAVWIGWPDPAVE